MNVVDLRSYTNPEISGYRLARICALKAAARAREALKVANRLQRSAINDLIRAQEKLADLRNGYYDRPPRRNRWLDDLPGWNP